MMTSESSTCCSTSRLACSAEILEPSSSSTRGHPRWFPALPAAAADSPSEFIRSSKGHQPVSCHGTPCTIRRAAPSAVSAAESSCVRHLARPTAMRVSISSRGRPLLSPTCATSSHRLWPRWRRASASKRHASGASACSSVGIFAPWPSAASAAAECAGALLRHKEASCSSATAQASSEAPAPGSTRPLSSAPRSRCRQLRTRRSVSAAKSLVWPHASTVAVGPRPASPRAAVGAVVGECLFSARHRNSRWYTRSSR